jgi:chromosome segregation ATPase
MPDWVTWVFGAFATLGGMTGLAAFVRARGQNRVDDRRQLTDEQIALRQSMREQFAEVRQQLRDSEADKDKLEAQLLETAALSQRLLERSEAQEKRIKEQEAQIAALCTQNAQQAQQIAALTEERAAYIEQLSIAKSRAEFLEREVNTLRTENTRLRDKLPARTEE